jgi:hypothetical protein
MPTPTPLQRQSNCGAARRLAGEVGLANAPRPGPGSLRVGLLDALHLLGEAEVVAGVNLSEQ